jgi:hypothetical protein
LFPFCILSEPESCVHHHKRTVAQYNDVISFLLRHWTKRDEQSLQFLMICRLIGKTVFISVGNTFFLLLKHQWIENLFPRKQLYQAFSEWKTPSRGREVQTQHLSHSLRCISKHYLCLLRKPAPNYSRVEININYESLWKYELCPEVGRISTKNKRREFFSDAWLNVAL